MENNTNPKPSSVKDALLNFYKGQGHTLDDSVADQLLEEYKGNELKMFEETFKLYNFNMNDEERAMIESLIEPQKKKDGGMLSTDGSSTSPANVASAVAQNIDKGFFFPYTGELADPEKQTVFDYVEDDDVKASKYNPSTAHAFNVKEYKRDAEAQAYYALRDQKPDEKIVRENGRLMYESDAIAKRGRNTSAALNLSTNIRNDLDVNLILSNYYNDKGDKGYVRTLETRTAGGYSTELRKEKDLSYAISESKKDIEKSARKIRADIGDKVLDGYKEIVGITTGILQELGQSDLDISDPANRAMVIGTLEEMGVSQLGEYTLPQINKIMQNKSQYEQAYPQLNEFNGLVESYNSLTKYTEDKNNFPELRSASNKQEALQAIADSTLGNNVLTSAGLSNTTRIAMKTAASVPEFLGNLGKYAKEAMGMDDYTWVNALGDATSEFLNQPSIATTTQSKFQQGIYAEQAEIDGFKVDIEDGVAVNVRHDDGITLKDKELKQSIIEKYNKNPNEYDTKTELKRGGIWNTVVSGGTQFALSIGGAGVAKTATTKMVAGAATSMATVYPQLYTDALSTLGPANKQLASQYAAMVSAIVSAGSMAINPIEAGIFPATKELGINKLKSLATRAAATGRVVSSKELNSVVSVMSMQLKKAGYFAMDAAPALIKESVVEGGVVETAADVLGKEMVNAQLDDPSKKMKYDIPKDLIDNTLGELLGSGLPTIAAGGKPSDFVLDGIRQIALSSRRNEILESTNKAEEFRRVFDIIDSVPNFKSFPENKQQHIVDVALQVSLLEASDKGDQTSVVDDKGVDVDQVMAMAEQKRLEETGGSENLTEVERKYIDSQVTRRKIANAKQGDIFQTPSGELIEIGALDDSGMPTYKIGEGEFTPFESENMSMELQDMVGYTGDQELADGMNPSRKFVLDEIAIGTEEGSPNIVRPTPIVDEDVEVEAEPTPTPIETSQEVQDGISNILPGVKIVEHNNDAEIQEATGQEVREGVKINGFFDPNTNTIHVNKQAADGIDSAVLHEAVEAAIYKERMENPEMIDQFFDELSSMDEFSETQEGKTQSIKDFSEAYDGPRKKEAVVEYLTRVADGSIIIDDKPKSFQKIRDFINKLLEGVGLKPVDDSVNIRSYAQKLATALKNDLPVKQDGVTTAEPDVSDPSPDSNQLELEFSISDIDRMRISAIMEKAIDQGFDLSADDLSLLGETFGNKSISEVTDLYKSVKDTYVPDEKRAKNRIKEWLSNSQVGKTLNNYLKIDEIGRILKRQLAPQYGGDKNIIRLAEYSKGKRNQLILEANNMKAKLNELMEDGKLTKEQLNLYLDNGMDVTRWDPTDAAEVQGLSDSVVQAISDARDSIDQLSQSLIDMAVRKFHPGAAYPDKRKKVEKIMEEEGWTDQAKDVAEQYFSDAFAYMDAKSTSNVEEAVNFKDMQDFLDEKEADFTITPQQRELIESVNTITRKLVGDGALDSIKANLGTYVSRDYRIFLDKDYTPDAALREEWIKKRSEDLYEARKKFVPESQKGVVDALSFYDAAAREFDAMIEGYKGTSKVSGSEFKRDTGNLKRRKDLDPLMRQILGEYTDPLDRYIATMSNLISLSEKTKFLIDLRKFAVQANLAYPKQDPLRQVKQGDRVFKEVSTLEAGFNPFTGMMVEESLHDLITSYGKASSDRYLIAAKINKFINWNKIIGNFPQSAARNLLGNMKNAIANGYINPITSTFKTSVQGRPMMLKDAVAATALEVRNQLDKRKSKPMMVGGKPISLTSASERKQREAAMDEILSVLRESGVLDSNLELGLIKKYLLKPNTVAEDIQKSTVKKGKNAFVRGFEWTKERMEATFRAADDIHKIQGYLVERERYSRAMFGKDYDQLTPENQDIINIKATDIIKNVFPNFNRIGKFTRQLSEFFLMGNFISFQSEALRNSFMTIQIARDEMRSDNPKVRAIGVERMSSKLITTGATSALAATISMSNGVPLGLALPGLSGVMADEEDKKARQSMNKIIYPWLQKANVSLRFEGDKMFVRNLSAIDPAAFFTSIANAMMKSDSAGEAFGNTLMAAEEAFFDPTIMMQIYNQIKEGKNAYGEPIARPGREVQDYFTWGLRTIGPGVVGQVMDRLAREFSLDIQQSKREKNILGLLTGADEYEVKYHDSTKFYLKKAFGHEEGLSKNRSKLAASIALKLSRMDNYTTAEMNAVIEDDSTTKAMYRKIEKLRDDVDGFLTLGVPVQTIEESVPKRYRAYLMRRTDEIPPLYGDKTLIKNINKHLSNND